MELPIQVIKLVRRAWITDSEVKRIPVSAYQQLKQYNIEIWLQYGIDIRFFDGYHVKFLHPSDIHIKLNKYSIPGK